MRKISDFKAIFGRLRKTGLGKIIAGIGAILVPKCFFCTTAYAGAIAVCGLTDTAESNIGTQISVGVAFLVAVWSLAGSERFSTWKAVLIWTGFLFVAFSLLVKESDLLFYLGSSYYIIGLLFLSGQIQQLWSFINGKEVTVVDLAESQN
jgi:hypothetical protein